jgi:hypothetical protein
VAGACSCAAGTAALGADVQPIFATSCLGGGCHDAADDAAGLTLTSGAAFADLVGVATSQCNGARTRVVPGAPDSSYLIHKLTDVDACTGQQMPANATPRPWSEVATVVRWICAGAAND